LPRHPDRVLALFDKACLIEHQDTVWLPHRLSHELMVIPQHLFLIPAPITDKSLQATDRPPRDMEGHRLNRLAFELTQLANHVVKELRPRLTAAKTVVKGRLELPQFIQEAFHITGDNVKHRNSKALTISPTSW
jgi:hypothetical protein